MFDFGVTKTKDPALLASRILLMLLFVIFGWGKLVAFSGTTGYFAAIGVPMPEMAALMAIVMEFFVGLAIAVGLLTRPLAVIIAIYTLITALVGHPFWTMTGQAQTEAEINFFKNISIIGGLIALYVAGPGRYSLDAKLRLA